jgi:hypothetical protein
VACRALWAKLTIFVTVRDKVPGAIKLTDASAYYPQAAIIDGWAAANDYYESNKKTLVKLIKGWADANDHIVAHSNDAMTGLQKGHYCVRRHQPVCISFSYASLSRSDRKRNGSYTSKSLRNECKETRCKQSRQNGSSR